MHRICDGVCRPLQDIINSAGGANSIFSAVATVIENRKLEVIKINPREQKERLVIHVADETCQLFKFTYWGQAAVQASSKFSPGSIILLDQFIAKSRHSNVIEGFFGENTTTHLLYNKFGMSFEEGRFPILYKLCIELIKFSHSRYQLFYVNYAEDGGRTVLSQLLSSQQELSGVDSQAFKTAQNSCPQDMEQSCSSLLSGALSGDGEVTAMPFRQVTTTVPAAPTTAVPIKVLEDYKKILSRNNHNISLHIDKDLKIDIEDILVPEVQKRCQLFKHNRNVDQTQSHWSSACISSRWKVLDARTNAYICLCFESRNEAYNQAGSLFVLLDGEIIDWKVVSASPLLVQATHLLILREGGRSLTNYHDRFVLGHQKSSFIQELLVSEKSSLVKLSSGKRGKHLSSTLSKRVKVAGDFLSKQRKKRFSLQKCQFVGMSQTLESISTTSPHIHCDNMRCDAFLWQLLDQSLLWLVPQQKIRSISQPTSQCSLSYPEMKYRLLFFFLKHSGQVLKVCVNDPALTSLLGTVPASLLVEALLRPHSYAGSCCPACLPFLHHVHQTCGTRRDEQFSTSITTASATAATAAFTPALLDEALHHIICSVQRIFRSLASSPVLTHKARASGGGRAGATPAVLAVPQQGTPSTNKCPQDISLSIQEMIAHDEGLQVSSKDTDIDIDDHSMYISGSKEAFTVQLSYAAGALSCSSPGPDKKEGDMYVEGDVVDLILKAPSSTTLFFEAFS